MFDAATLMGLVWMLILGPAVGNYACSVVYRLPLGRTPFERHPYCGHCNADLQPKDLFPILSWLSTKGKCRYCHGAIPGIYTVIEVACLVLFVANFLTFGISETFLLLTAYGVFVIILAAIEWQQDWISSSVYGYALSFAALNSTMLEASIFGWVQDYVIMMVMVLIVARVIAAARRQAFRPFETSWVWWLGLVVVSVPIPVIYMPWLALVALPVAIHPTRLSAPAFAALATALPLILSI